MDVDRQASSMSSGRGPIVFGPASYEQLSQFLFHQKHNQNEQ
jgi:hypothetical protein